MIDNRPRSTEKREAWSISVILRQKNIADRRKGEEIEVIVLTG